MQIPRVEIVRGDRGARFIAKVLFARQLGAAAPATQWAGDFTWRVAIRGPRRLRRALRRRSVAAADDS
jgi:hypothetical protein